MDDQVLLCIEGGKFVLSPEEAMQICHVLNGANRITTAWVRSTSKSEEIIGEPSINAASIVPITAHYRIRLDANARQKDAEK